MQPRGNVIRISKRYLFQQCDSNNINKWTINNNLPCSDNNMRTKDDHCVTGICVGTFYNCPSCEAHDGSGCPIKPGYCVIQHRGQKTCFARNQYKPGNPCQVCSDSKQYLLSFKLEGYRLKIITKCSPRFN